MVSWLRITSAAEKGRTFAVHVSQAEMLLVSIAQKWWSLVVREGVQQFLGITVRNDLPRRCKREAAETSERGAWVSQ